MLLQLKDISKSFGTEQLLAHVDIIINENARIGMVGANGAGKTTLLKIMAGQQGCDGGDLFRSKDLSIGILGQQHAFDNSKTVFETVLGHFEVVLDIEQRLRLVEMRMAIDAKAAHEYSRLTAEYERLDGYSVDARANAVLNGLGFADAKNKLVGVLSGGEKTRLGLALLLVDAPQLLLLDEPTNHLDMDMLDWLEKYIADYRGAVVTVTHDRYFLDATCSEIIDIEHGAAKSYSGNYSLFVERKALDRAAALKAYTAQRKQMAEMRDFVERNIVRASTTGRAKSRLKALEKIEVLDRPEDDQQARFTIAAGRPSGNDVLQLRDLSVSVGNAAVQLISGLNLLVKRGERIAIIGCNGAGKTTLLKTLAGQHSERSGYLRWGENVKRYYYDQEHACLNAAHTLLEELHEEHPQLDDVVLRNLLGRLLFSGEDVYKPVGVLSGGERARIAIAKLLLVESNTLLLDEPTNHIDIHCREVLEDSLCDYAGTLIFVSHDRYFINKLATKIMLITACGVQIFDNPSAAFAAAKAPASPSIQPPTTRPSTIQPPTTRPSIRNEQQQQRLETQIERLENECAIVARELERVSASGEQERLLELYALLEEQRIRLDELYSEWQALY